MVLVELLVVGAIYFIPSVVAGYGKHPNTTPIFILNLTLGWTIIGWIGALIWATTKNGDKNGKH